MGKCHYLEVSGKLHTSAALPAGMGTRFPLDGTLGGPQSRCGFCGQVAGLCIYLLHMIACSFRAFLT
jgi:hypothetical protein